MQTQTPSADVCTTPYGIDAEAKKTIQALRKKLSRWELDHLRAHCVKLANELEEAQATIERLTEERDSAESWAEGWREDVNRLVTALEGAGQQVGLTQCGAVVAMPAHGAAQQSAAKGGAA